MNTITESKKFSTAFLFWIFLGGLGAHRVYMNENPVTLIWYWLGTLCTFGILPLVDVFLIKNKVLLINNNIEERKRNQETYAHYAAQRHVQKESGAGYGTSPAPSNEVVYNDTFFRNDSNNTESESKVPSDSGSSSYTD